MISKRTADAVYEVIRYWAEAKKLAPHDVQQLLESLARIPGNKSYRDTTAALLQLWRSSKRS